MQRAINVDLSHAIGKDEAKRRIAGNIGSLGQHIPGGVADVTERWEGDSLHMVIGAMGQEVNARLDIEETKVHIMVELPGMLAMFAGPIEALFRAKGEELLLEKPRED